MQVYNNKVIISDSIKQTNTGKTGNTVSSNGSPGFNEVLSNKLYETQPLQFSKHASLRLGSRDLALTNDQIKRVEEGITKAREKGINDSLVLVDSVALVVNVKNKVVVTAMNKGSENIFTNIDGAVIV